MIQLATAGGIGVGQLQQQMHQFGPGGLGGAPGAQGGAAAPELVKPIGGELEQVGGFGGAEVFDRPSVHHPQPAHQGAGAMAFHRAPFLPGRQLDQAAQAATLHPPDAVGLFPGVEQHLAGAQAALRRSLNQQELQIGINNRLLAHGGLQSPQLIRSVWESPAAGLHGPARVAGPDRSPGWGS